MNNDFEKWIASKHGQDCLAFPVTDVEYLRNRLWWAFDAGRQAERDNAAIERLSPSADGQRDEKGRPMTYWGGKPNDAGDNHDSK